MPAINFAAFSTAEKQALLTSAKARLLVLVGGGAIQTGASNGQSFSILPMTEKGLMQLISDLTEELGYPQPITQVVPNFSGRRYGFNELTS